MRDTTWTAPVRYAETDQQGVVFNAHYLTYCDEAFADHFAALGLPYQQLIDRGVDVQLVTSTLTWKSGARWGEQVSVDTRCEEIGRTSLRFAFTVRAGERVCCEVATTYVAVATDSMRPTPVPDWLRVALEGP